MNIYELIYRQKKSLLQPKVDIIFFFQLLL